MYLHMCMYIYRYIYISVYYRTKLNNATEFQDNVFQIEDVNSNLILYKCTLIIYRVLN